MSSMFTDKAMKITFLLSLTGHLLFFGMTFQLRPNSQIEDIPKDSEIVYIEIENPPLLPKIDVMGEEKKLKEIMGKSEQSEPEPELEPQPEEVVVEEFPNQPVEKKVEVIDPTQEAMLRYQDMVKQRIEETRRYPSWAKRQGIEGVSYLIFTLLSNGAVQDIRIIRSSGFDILDEEAISTVKRASLFKPIPEKFNCSSLTMEVALAFQLK